MSGRGSKRKASPTNVAKNNDGDVSAAKKVRVSKKKIPYIIRTTFPKKKVLYCEDLSCKAFQL